MTPATGSRRPQSVDAVALRYIAVVAVLATVAVAATVNDPGVTCDEYYDVAAGKRLVTAWRTQGWSFFRSENIERNYGSLTLHPPLGRWLLGWMQAPFDIAPGDPNAVSLIGARFAPALAFGWLVWLVGWTSARSVGPLAGIIASAAVAVAPRLFAHAHLATLDTFAAVSFVSAVLAVVAASERGAKGWQFGLAGLVWGLALATKIHGVLLLPPVVLWMAWYLRRRAFAALAWWGGAGAIVFYALWPWLWLAPLGNLKAYLSTATQRQSLHVFYFGQVWDDRLVPWHYPWVVFAATIPLGLLILGLVGISTSRKALWTDARRCLILGCTVWVLLVFSLPGTPIYDGARLFLMIFPLWAVWVGYGAQWLSDRMQQRGWRPRTVWLLLGASLIGPVASIVLYHPFQLSYYSPLVGGLAGATRLGFEVSYWGDSIDGDLLAAVAEIPEGEAILFAPNLAPYQAPAVEISSAALQSRQIHLIGWNAQDPAEAANCRYALLYHRRADLETLDFVLRHGRVIRQSEHGGIWLGRLYKLPEPVGTLLDEP